MSGTKQEVLLGCDPQVRVVITEDQGNLVLQVYAEDPEITDIDALFFNLNDDAQADGLTIWPEINVESVTGFDVATGQLNQLNNGAQVQEQYDVRVEFGELGDTSLGDIDEAAFTLYVDGGPNGLTLDSLDLDNMTAVINSDSGNGLALTSGGGAPDAVQPVITTAMSENFDGLWDPAHSVNIVCDDGWDVRNGELYTDGCNDGRLVFAEVPTNDPVALNIDMRAENVGNFENSGWSEDSLRLEVQIDDGQWVLLDEFQVNDSGTAMVGSNTGQTFDGDMTTLSYSGGVLDTASDNVQFRIVSDISASDERIYVDNVEILTIEEGTVGGTEETTTHSEDFSHLWHADQSEMIASDGNWAVSCGELYTNGYYDGTLTTETYATEGPATISFTADADNLWAFENCGWGEDSLTLQVQVDGGDWVTLDRFEVNDQKSALVGSQTGQTITAHDSDLSYSGGVLDGASESVQFRFVSDISANNEIIKIDDIEITTTEIVPGDGTATETCEDFEDASAGDTAALQFDGFSVTAQRTGEDETSQNDAMVFDTANPTGYDWDLHYADQGNAIIISEDNDANDPDDNWNGGTISFSFEEISEVGSLTLLDVEEAGGTIDLYDADDELIQTIDIPAGYNNGSQELAINVSGVATMDVNLVGSGAVDDLCFTPQAEVDGCDQYAVAYDDFFKPALTDEELAALEGATAEEEDMLDEAVI